MSNREIYNASGCLDLTAYLALRNIEREMDRGSKSAMKNRGRRKRKNQDGSSDRSGDGNSAFPGSAEIAARFINSLFESRRDSAK